MSKYEATLTRFMARRGVVVKYVGVPVYVWDPPVISYASGSEDNTSERVSNLAHEVAHWLICSGRRRRLKDFGLGRAPDSFQSSARILMQRNAQREESKASLLGMLIEQCLGHDFSRTFVEHGWEEPRSSLDLTMEQHFEGLSKRGFARRRGTVGPLLGYELNRWTIRL